MGAVGLRKEHDKWGIGGLIVVAWSLWVLPTLAQPGGAAMVEVAPVVQQTIAQPVVFVGTVEPSRRSQVASEVEGIVEQLLVEEGQLVNQGDTLLQLRQESLHILLRARQATAERHRQELAELKNGTRPEVIAEAAAEVAEAEAELARSHREMSRQMDLSGRGVAAVRSREDAETDAKVAQQRLMRARKRYELAVQGPRVEQIAQAEAQYQAAQAEVAALQYDLQRSQVPAPFRGFVVAKHTEVGQWLDRGDPVVTLIELSEAHITVPIPERYIPHVQLGADGLVQFDALPEATWQGEMIRIIPQATASRTFPVTIAVANPELYIKSGFFARVTLQVGEQQNALMVPKDAIVTQGPRHLVYVVREGKAVSVPVQRTAFHEGFAVVTGSLQPGEQVVIRGNERLRPGQPVQVAQTG
jgi:multidrug efflux pump subunit AcrA (membrane-fusion protein)